MAARDAYRRVFSPGVRWQDRRCGTTTRTYSPVARRKENGQNARKKEGRNRLWPMKVWFDANDIDWVPGSSTVGAPMPSAGATPSGFGDARNRSEPPPNAPALPHHAVSQHAARTVPPRSAAGSCPSARERSQHPSRKLPCLRLGGSRCSRLDWWHPWLESLARLLICAACARRPRPGCAA
jgi:hypothetical protein